MKNIILFGIGANGRQIVETYRIFEQRFRIIAIADNFSVLQEFQGIPVIKPDHISDFLYDEIWITTIYYREIKEQLRDRLQIEQSFIRYIEYPMPFLEQQIYEKYKAELAGEKKCESDELQTVIEYVAVHGVRMYCYPFFDEYEGKDYPVFYDEEYGLYYGIYSGHKIYLAKQYNTPEKAEHYLRCIYMEQDQRSPHCYFAGGFQALDGETGVDIGAAEGIFTLAVIEKVAHVYLIEAEADWCEALALTFREYEKKVTIIQGRATDSDGPGQITLDKLLEDIAIDFIKMDIEGNEHKALLGAERLIKKNMPKLAVCTYHRSNDYHDIGDWLRNKGYLIDNSQGYVVCQGEWELENLFDVDFRRALLWAERA